MNAVVPSCISGYTHAYPSFSVMWFFGCVQWDWISGFSLQCKKMWGMFSWHALALILPKQALFECRSLAEYICSAWAFLTKLVSNWLHEHYHEFRWSAFRMLWEMRFKAWISSWQICTNNVMQSYLHGPGSHRNVSTTLELRLFGKPTNKTSG